MPAVVDVNEPPADQLIPSVDVWHAVVAVAATDNHLVPAQIICVPVMFVPNVVVKLVYFLPTTEYKLEYVDCDTHEPSHANQVPLPVGVDGVETMAPIGNVAPLPPPAAAQVAVVPLLVNTCVLVPIASLVTAALPVPTIKSPAVVTVLNGIVAGAALVHNVPSLVSRLPLVPGVTTYRASNAACTFKLPSGAVGV